MPKGSPRAGFRKKRKPDGSMGLPVRHFAKALQQINADVGNDNETDEQVDKRIGERFTVMEAMVRSAIEGGIPALIISGPAGVGKSRTVEDVLKELDPKGIRSTVVRGYVRTTGLTKVLYEYQHPGNIIVFDDADKIFSDETSLNMLKAVCDTNALRNVSYLSEYQLIDADGLPIPKKFDFQGTIIFITNYDFDSIVEKGNMKLAPHLNALMSRALYLDLEMKSRRDCMVRIKQVLKLGMLKNRGCSKDEEKDVLGFLEANIDQMRELSLRSALKVADIRKRNVKGIGWEAVARMTCCKK